MNRKATIFSVESKFKCEKKRGKKEEEEK